MIEIPDTVAIFITVFGAGFCFLLAIGQLIMIPRQENQFVLASFFILVSVFLLNLGLGKDYVLEHLPYMYAIHVPFYYLSAPLFSSYLSAILQDKKPDGEERLLVSPGYSTFIPFIFAFLIYTPFFIQSSQWKIRFLNQYDKHLHLLIYRYTLDGVIFGGLTSSLFHFGRTLVKINALELLRQEGQNVVLWHLRAMLFWLVLLSIFAIPIQYFESLPFKRYAAMSMAIVIFWLYLLDYRHPGFFRGIDRAIRTRGRYRKSRIEGLNVPATIFALERFMANERLYVDDDLTLERLAIVLEITPKQLSEILNNVMKTDFRSFLNQYRISEARRLLLSSPHRSILSIAFDVGFNSKASFNRNFKLITKQTPVEFRKINRIESV